MNLRRILALPMALALVSAAPVPQHWAERNGWGFDNFTTASLSWDIYRDAFIGVPPTRDPWSSAFDVLFFDNMYETELAKTGNCYGMSVLSLYLWKNEGHQGICAPASQYSSAQIAAPNMPLYRLINTVHGHQVNLPTLRMLLDILGLSKNRDGNYAFAQLQYYLALQDPTLVSVTKSLSPADGGHTMVAYDGRTLGGGAKQILVYDPNRPWFSDSAWYLSGSNVVAIDGGGNWSFDIDASTVWSGGPSNGGNIMITPLSITGPPSRLPTSLGLNALSLITTIFVYGGGGSLEQVTDADGKRLFRPGTIEIDANPATGMLNLVPWYPSDGMAAGGPRGAAYFFVSPPGPALNVQVKGGDTGYAVALIGARGLVRIAATGSALRDTVHIESGSADIPDVVLRNDSGASSYDVELHSAGGVDERANVVRLSDLRLPRGASARLRPEPGGAGFSIASTEGVLEARVGVEARSAWEQSIFDAGVLRVEPGRPKLVLTKDSDDSGKPGLDVSELPPEPPPKER